MRIAMVAAYEETVPPEKYGGTELVVSNVTEELVKLGHDVTLFAAGGSKTAGHFVENILDRPIRAIPEAQDLDIRNVYKEIVLGKILAYLQQHRFDIVHQHLSYRFLPFAHLVPCPIISTLHSTLDVPHQQIVFNQFAQLPYVSISLNQRKPMPHLNYVANIYNGIEVDKFRFVAEPSDYFAFLGRMSPEKGPVQAIQIAKHAGVKLIMAGKVDSVDKAFFDKDVAPLIDNNQVTFIGEVDHPQKVELLSHAKALIAPIQWEEPFGLFFVEAMACGTPVITMNRGSVPEIVINNKTGFICNTLEEAVAKVAQIPKLNRQDCFAQASNNFSAIVMAKAYVAAYQKVLGQS